MDPSMSKYQLKSISNAAQPAGTVLRNNSLITQLKIQMI